MDGRMRATPVKVKVCGLFRQADIWAINQAKPDYCGFVVNFPKSHRSLSPEAVRLLRAGLDAAVTPVGVFVNQPVELVAGLLNSDVVSVAQLHGSEDGTYLAALRSLTHGPIWQAFAVRSAADLERAAASAADFVLLDAGQGTGQSFDWSLLAGFPRPFGLAGGLHTGNLEEALKTGAALLDVSGGVETEKCKDAEKIREFVRIAYSNTGPLPLPER